MLRNVFLSLVFVAMTVATSSATILNSDGDFGMQSQYSQITTPWGPVGGYPIAASDSQSPFTNVYTNNSIGGNLLGNDGEYLVGAFDSQTVETAPMLYYNFDVRFNQEDTSIESYQRFALALNAGVETMFEVMVGTSEVWVGNGTGSFDQVVDCNISGNTWYNFQFAFDLANLTYTGRVANETEAFDIATRTINSSATAVPPNNWNGTVNTLFTDGRSNGIPHPDSYDVDNFAVSDSPFTTVGPTATPEGPGDPERVYDKVVNIDFNGYRDGDDPATSVTYTPESGEIWNGIEVNSLNGNDNVSISGSNLLDTEGNSTTVNFAASPVGGDIEMSVGTDNLLHDYLFTHSAGNDTDAAFTISGLGDLETIALSFHTPWNNLLGSIIVNGAEVYSDLNTQMGIGAGNFFYDVPVVNGEVTGTFGNGSGETVVVSGMSIFIPESENPLTPGDANGDGKVDGSDVTILAGNWQKGVNDGLTAIWEEGDFNGDGKVDGSDVTILAGNWQAGVTTAAASVPEPSMTLLILGGLLSSMLIRRKR